MTGQCFITPTHCERCPMSAERKSKVVLTPQLAVEIYLHKLALENSGNIASSFDPSKLLKGRSVPISKKYNVSAKTIRDVWNRKTWAFATEKVIKDKFLKVWLLVLSSFSNVTLCLTCKFLSVGHSCVPGWHVRTSKTNSFSAESRVIDFPAQS